MLLLFFFKTVLVWHTSAIKFSYLDSFLSFESVSYSIHRTIQFVLYLQFRLWQADEALESRSLRCEQSSRSITSPRCWEYRSRSSRDRWISIAQEVAQVRVAPEMQWQDHVVRLSRPRCCCLTAQPCPLACSCGDGTPLHRVHWHKNARPNSFHTPVGEQLPFQVLQNEMEKKFVIHCRQKTGAPRFTVVEYCIGEGMTKTCGDGDRTWL